MPRRKKNPIEDYFNKNTAGFIDFGNKFAAMLNDEKIMDAAAQKDIEKVAKVWKPVIETLAENSAALSPDKTAELIGAYKKLGEEDDE